jgi:hypothetical protein
MNECPAGLLEVSPADGPCRNNGSGKWLAVLTERNYRAHPRLYPSVTAWSHTAFLELRADRPHHQLATTAALDPKVTSVRRGLLRSGLHQRATDVGSIRLSIGSTATQDGFTDQPPR